MFHYACRICYSEYREEIEKLLSQRLKFREVARKYQETFNVDLHLLEQSIATHYKKHRPKEPTEEEKELLERIRKDEVSIDEIQRFVAVKAVENMLLNPNRIKFNDYIRTQNLLMRKEKMKQKRSWDYSDYEALFSKLR
ncbi:hypothetical protein HY409_03125 [Candidatus Gottesmanbacteria bacterium]|nr:hypothetical protein [Candidatus Gottesmanbacteria bacterium]